MAELVTGMHPKLVEALSAFNAEAKARNLIGAMHSGLRTEEEQQKLYAKGRTVPNPDGIVTNAKSAYDSWHGFGLAFDWVFKDPKGNWTWNGMPGVFKNEMTGLWKWNHELDNKWHELGKVGAMFGLEWGGYWEKFRPDFPHFQMRGIFNNTAEAKKLLLENNIEAVWGLI